MSNLQKIIDEFQKDLKEKAKNYVTEGSTLDYLRPEKDTGPKYINISNRIRGPPSRNYQIKIVKEKKLVDDSDKADEKSDDKIEAEKIKNERSNRAFMRFRRNQEKKSRK